MNTIYFNIFNILIRLQTDSIRIMEEAALLFKNYIVKSAGTAVVEIVLCEKYNTGQPGARFNDPKKLNIQQLDSNRLEIITNEGSAQYDLEKSEINGWVRPRESVTKDQNETISLFQILINRIMIAHEYIPVHGASLLYKNKAFLISGPSQAGKSSLALFLQGKGIHVLGDDLAYLKSFKNGLKIGGLRQPLKIKKKHPIRSDELIPCETTHAKVIGKNLFNFKINRTETFNALFSLSHIFFLSPISDINDNLVSEMGAIPSTQAMFHLLKAATNKNVFFDMAFFFAQLTALDRIKAFQIHKRGSIASLGQHILDIVKA